MISPEASLAIALARAAQGAQLVEDEGLKRASLGVWSRNEMARVNLED